MVVLRQILQPGVFVYFAKFVTINDSDFNVRHHVDGSIVET